MCEKMQNSPEQNVDNVELFRKKNIDTKSLTNNTTKKYIKKKSNKHHLYNNKEIHLNNEESKILSLQKKKQKTKKNVYIFDHIKYYERVKKWKEKRYGYDYEKKKKTITRQKKELPLHIKNNNQKKKNKVVQKNDINKNITINKNFIDSNDQIVTCAKGYKDVVKNVEQYKHVEKNNKNKIYHYNYNIKNENFMNNYTPIIELSNSNSNNNNDNSFYYYNMGGEAIANNTYKNLNHIDILKSSETILLQDQNKINFSNKTIIDSFQDIESFQNLYCEQDGDKYNDMDIIPMSNDTHIHHPLMINKLTHFYNKYNFISLKNKMIFDPYNYENNKYKRFTFPYFKSTSICRNGSIIKKKHKSDEYINKQKKENKDIDYFKNKYDKNHSYLKNIFANNHMDENKIKKYHKKKNNLLNKPFIKTSIYKERIDINKLESNIFRNNIIQYQDNINTPTLHILNEYSPKDLNMELINNPTYKNIKYVHHNKKKINKYNNIYKMEHLNKKKINKYNNIYKMEHLNKTNDSYGYNNTYNYNKNDNLMEDEKNYTYVCVTPTFITLRNKNIKNKITHNNNNNNNNINNNNFNKINRNIYANKKKMPHYFKNYNFIGKNVKYLSNNKIFKNVNLDIHKYNRNIYDYKKCKNNQKGSNKIKGLSITPCLLPLKNKKKYNFSYNIYKQVDLQNNVLNINKHKKLLHIDEKDIKKNFDIFLCLFMKYEKNESQLLLLIHDEDLTRYSFFYQTYIKPILDNYKKCKWEKIKNSNINEQKIKERKYYTDYNNITVNKIILQIFIPSIKKNYLKYLNILYYKNTNTLDINTSEELLKEIIKIDKQINNTRRKSHDINTKYVSVASNHAYEKKIKLIPKPEWANKNNLKLLLKRQEHINPFTIFGTSVKEVNLEEIFTLDVYNNYITNDDRYKNKILYELYVGNYIHNLYEKITYDEWNNVLDILKKHWNNFITLECNMILDPLLLEEILWYIDNNKMYKDKSKHMYTYENCFCPTPDPKKEINFNDSKNFSKSMSNKYTFQKINKFKKYSLNEESIYKDDHILLKYDDVYSRCTLLSNPKKKLKKKTTTTTTTTTTTNNNNNNNNNNIGVYDIIDNNYNINCNNFKNNKNMLEKQNMLMHIPRPSSAIYYDINFFKNKVKKNIFTKKFKCENISYSNMLQYNNYSVIRSKSKKWISQNYFDNFFSNYYLYNFGTIDGTYNYTI
ncbi:conserved Plasmodium protein, unknown function [Plasmodium gaboni]|uniref:Inner centromere protein ARK-binding domain-containing protein n=1 Tax=Plasmodium gaboni TaxID=647221 RepID=A0ABY1USC7_9APIC|nr:conserved Plasmodium protein, unknown function [Plasmodium gaboni]